MIMLVVVVLAAVVALVAAEQPTVEVTLKQGTILGSQMKANNGHLYYSFKSIPYARPPVGPLRFKNPKPALPWSGVRNGSLTIPKCPQANSRAFGTIEGQEDCLYLNVYTPKIHSANLPVMVYIHGGGFVDSSAEDFGLIPAPLLQKDVVVVAINYRLGALGFLSTGDSVLPGNLGLKDQVLALRWVQDNIRDLGGNPNQVTIFGLSAGGVSVHYHVLSPSSKELFQRAIMQSGTALVTSFSCSPWKGAISLSKALNCTGEESQQLLACFKEATVEDLVNVPNTLGEWFNMPCPVGPCVDGTFLPDHPAVLLKDGRYNKVDIMSGTTKDEGNVLTTGLFSKIGTQALQQLNDNFTRVGPIMLSTTEEENPVYLARRLMLKDMDYNTDFNITQNDELALTKILGDRYFQAPNIKAVEFHARDQTRQTFMYQFDHYAEMSVMSLLMNTTQNRKIVGHGDDMIYFFENPESPDGLRRPSDLHMQDILVTLWTNFASTGNPTVNGTLGFRWTPVTPTGPLHYLSLTTTPTMQAVDSREREFWNSLPTTINKLLYPERFLDEF